MRRGLLIIVYRTLFALLGFSAVVTEIATLSERGRLVPGNFFSFFTVESNLFAIGILLASALAAAGGAQSRVVSVLRGASTLYMAVVGSVFPVLLAGLDAELTAVPWDNTVLHYLMPVAVVADWFFDMPTTRIPFKEALIWTVFPILYVVYTLIRGHLVSWYPYPFLNPGSHGYFGVVITSIGIALGATGVIWFLARFTGRGVSEGATLRH